MDELTRYRRIAAYLPWSGSPLMRRGDRMLATTIIAALALILLSVPLCVWAAKSTYQSVTDRTQGSIATTATVLRVTDADPAALQTSATVAWSDSAGRHTDTTVVPRGTQPGSLIDVWTSPDGTTLQEHPGTAERVLGALWVGALAWITVIAVALGVIVFVRRCVTRAHGLRWDREWAQAGRTNGWAAH